MKGAVHLAVTTLCFVTGLLAQSQITVAVLDLESHDISEDESAILSNRLQSVLIEYRDFRVPGRDHSGWEEIENNQRGANAALSGIEMGSLLDAQVIIGGSVGKNRDSYSVDVWAIEAETGEIKASITRTVQGKVNELLPVMIQIGEELVRYISPNTPKLSPFRVDHTSKRLKSIAVSDFKAYGLVEAEVTQISDQLSTQIGRTGAVDVFERNQMNYILEEQDFIISEPVHLACAVDVGKLFAVDYIIVGSIGKIGSTYAVDLQVVDLHTELLVNSYYYDYHGQFSDLTDRPDKFVWELIGVSRTLVHFPRGPQTQTTARPSKKPASKTDNTPPAIHIYEPPITRGMKQVQQDKTVLIKGRATDASGIFEVLVNQQDAELDAQGNFWTEVRLRVGENRIAVKATDMHDNSASTAFTVVREAGEAPEPDVAGGDDLIKGQYYALIIGIDSYGGEWDRLRNAVHDARGVKDALESQYRFDHFITLFDQEATRANIIIKLEWLADNLNEDDNLLIYYSGHGEFKENLNKGYWVPVDAKGKSTVNYVSNSDLQTFLNGIPTRHTLLVSDACFSGGIFKGRTESIKPGDFEDMDRYYQQVYGRLSREAITSGGVEPVMDGGREGHSVFAYYFLKALKENREYYYESDKLFFDLKIAVTNNSDQTPRHDPIKNTGDEGGKFIFVGK